MQITLAVGCRKRRIQKCKNIWKKYETITIIYFLLYSRSILSNHSNFNFNNFSKFKKFKNRFRIEKYRRKKHIVTIKFRQKKDDKNRNQMNECLEKFFKYVIIIQVILFKIK